MELLRGFSERLQLPNIPQGPGVYVIENSRGRVLQVAASNNIRRRIGEMFDSQGTICVHGPKICDVQQPGERIHVGWKLTPDYKAEKRRLMDALNPSLAE
jgi:hypothetical protein